MAKIKSSDLLKTGFQRVRTASGKIKWKTPSGGYTDFKGASKRVVKDRETKEARKRVEKYARDKGFKWDKEAKKFKRRGKTFSPKQIEKQKERDKELAKKKPSYKSKFEKKAKAILESSVGKATDKQVTKLADILKSHSRELNQEKRGSAVFDIRGYFESEFGLDLDYGSDAEWYVVLTE